MKFIASLPKCFKPQGQNEKGIYLFSDNKSDLVRLMSPVSHPASNQKEWVVLIREYRQKSDSTEYPYRLIFKLFEIDDTHSDLAKVRIEREVFKGTFASSNRPTLYFAAFPLERMIWLTYSIYRVGG